MSKNIPEQKRALTIYLKLPNTPIFYHFVYKWPTFSFYLIDIINKICVYLIYGRKEENEDGC